MSQSAESHVDDEGFRNFTTEWFHLCAGKLTGLPFTFLWRCCVCWERCWNGDDDYFNMALVGTMPADGDRGDRLQYQEICSLTNEYHARARLNLDVFLPLRAQIQELFPQTTDLSDMQILMLLTCVTPARSVEEGRDIDSEDDEADSYGRMLREIVKNFAHVELMPGHPRAPPSGPALVGEESTVPGVPSGIYYDNSTTGHRGRGGYHYFDGLPITAHTLYDDESHVFRDRVRQKLSLVTQFHLRQPH